MRGILTAFAVAAFLAHAAIFALFLADAHRLGGTALHGEESAGRYWVSDHGRRAEVSAEAFRRNRWMGIAVFAGAPVSMAGVGFLLFTRAFPRAIYLRRGEDLGAAEKRVLRSGPPIAGARTGGRLGWVNFGGPMLRVSVHPGGLLVKPLWMPPFAIERGHVISVARSRFLLTERTEIVHRSPDVRSPIRLEGRQDPAFLAAIEGLSPPAGRPSGRAPGRPPSGRSGRP